MSTPHPFSPPILPRLCPIPQGQNTWRGHCPPPWWAQDFGLLRLWLSSCCLCWLWSSRLPLRPLWCASFRDHLHLSCVGHQCFTMKRGDHRARFPSFPPGPTGTFEPSFLCLPKMSAVSLAHCQPGFLCWLCRCGRAPVVWRQEPVPAVERPAKLCLYQLFSFGQGT